MITVHRNTEFKRSWILQSVDGTPTDVTGAYCELFIFDSMDEQTLVFSCDQTNFITVTGADGLFECVIPADDFILPAGDYALTCRAILDPETDRRVIMLETKSLHVRHFPEV